MMMIRWALFTKPRGEEKRGFNPRLLTVHTYADAIRLAEKLKAPEYGTGSLVKEPNPTGGPPRDFIGLCKPTETSEGTKRRRPKKPGGGRERKRGLRKGTA